MEPIPAASFGKSHIKLIAVSIILLVAASFMRGGLKLSSFGAASAESAPKPITLEEAQAKAHAIVAAQATADGDDSAAAAQQTKEQLAELDPNLADELAGGSVLGASTGVDPTVDADQVLNSDTVTSLPITSYVTSDSLDFNTYATQIHRVESKYGANVIIGALSGRDEASLQGAANNYKGIVAELRTMRVPSQFLEYHRMKLVYYAALAQMASSMTADGPDDSAASAASLFFSLNDKIKSMRTQLNSQYEVIL